MKKSNLLEQNVTVNVQRLNFHNFRNICLHFLIGVWLQQYVARSSNITNWTSREQVLILTNTLTNTNLVIVVIRNAV
jgi:hypothetical protein